MALPRHTARAETFENSLVVVTGFGRPSDATWVFLIFIMTQTTRYTRKTRINKKDNNMGAVPMQLNYMDYIPEKTLQLYKCLWPNLDTLIMD